MVIKASLNTFSVKIPYTVTTFKNLQRLGEYEKEEDGIYAWTFPLAHFEEVQAMLNEEISFKEEPLILALKHCPELKEKVETTVDKKGQGYCIVIAQSPEIFEVEYIEGGDPVRKKVERATVKRIYDIAIKHLEEGKAYPSREVAGKVITDYPLERFQRESGSPDVSKFYGTRNLTGYFGFFYYPLKVLQALDIIEHTRSGHIIRRTEWCDKLVDMAHFSEIQLWGNAPPVEERGTITNW